MGGFGVQATVSVFISRLLRGAQIVLLRPLLFSGQLLWAQCPHSVRNRVVGRWKIRSLSAPLNFTALSCEQVSVQSHFLPTLYPLPVIPFHDTSTKFDTFTAQCYFLGQELALTSLDGDIQSSFFHSSLYSSTRGNYLGRLRVLVTFLFAVTKPPVKSNLWKEEFILTHNWRVQPIMVEDYHGNRSMRQLATLHLPSGSRER